MTTTAEDEIIDTPEVPELEDDGNTPDAPAKDDGAKDEQPEDEQQEAEEKPPASGSIPKARLNEVIAQREALKEQLAERERQLAELQAGKSQPAAQPTQAQPAAPELKALRAQYREALMEGDMDKAAELDEQIDEVVLQHAEARVMHRQAQQKSDSELQATANQAYTDFPYLLTPEGSEVETLILLSRDNKVAAGTPISQALREAVAAIAPRFAPEGSSPGAGLQKPAEKVDNRTINANARGAADSAKQPPVVQAGVGNRATAGRVDIGSMTDAQIAAIPKEELDRLLGNA